jgi:hypothetical protein
MRSAYFWMIFKFMMVALLSQKYEIHNSQHISETHSTFNTLSIPNILQNKDNKKYNYA